MGKWFLHKIVDGIEELPDSNILVLDAHKCPENYTIMEWIKHMVDDGILSYNDIETTPNNE